MPLVTDPDVDTILRKTPALTVRPIAHESVAVSRLGTVGRVDLCRPYAQGTRSERICRSEDFCTCGAAPDPGFPADDGPSVVMKTLDWRVVDTSVRALVTRITASGRKVLIVEPPPSVDFDIYQCAQRKLEGLLYFGPSANCQIGQAAATLRDASLAALLRTLKPIAGVQPYSFNALLCDGKSCRTKLDNTTLYRDEGHFSPQGSRVIGSQSSLNASASGLLATTTGTP